MEKLSDIFSCMKETKVYFHPYRYFDQLYSDGKIGAFKKNMETCNCELSLLSLIELMSKNHYLYMDSERRWHSLNELNFNMLTMDTPVISVVVIKNQDMVVFVPVYNMDYAIDVCAAYIIPKPVVDATELLVCGVFILNKEVRTCQSDKN